MCTQVAAPTEEQDDEDSNDIEERRASNAAATSSESDDLPLGATEDLRAFDALVDSWLVRHAQKPGYCAIQLHVHCPSGKSS